MAKLIGLDVSTSCIGVALSDETGVRTTHIDVGKAGDFYDKVAAFREWISSNARDASAVWIEEPVQSFRAGFSSAGTISLLQRFNGAVSAVTYIETGVRPIHIPVATARKLAGYSARKNWSGGKVPEKKKVFAWAMVNFQDAFEWSPIAMSHIESQEDPWEQKGIKKQWYDEVDALVVLMAGRLQCV